MVIPSPTQNKVENLYFLGIGGIAMGSVAIACREQGFTVSGSDSGVYPPMSTMLEQSGICYAQEYNAQHLLSFKPDVVIVGNAISRGNPTLEAALEANLPLLSLPELLRWYFLQHRTRIVVTGTHGKTTTTSMITWILRSNGLPVGHLIGGAVERLGASCSVAPVGGYFVMEGDEYDSAFFDKRSKFLHTMPHLLVITSIEYDHADIFPSYESVCASFEQLVRLVPRNGCIVVSNDDPGARAIGDRALVPVIRYGLDDGSHLQSHIINRDENGTVFSVTERGMSIGTFHLPMHGEHNVRNVTAAIAIARLVGLDTSQIAHALQSFTPPKRRFEILCTWRGVTVVDDFAHHPTAVKATLQSARDRFPQRRIIACFEPRSNTSVRSIFQREFAEALAYADAVVLCPVYRADRYTPDERLDRDLLQRDLEAQGVPCYQVPDGPQWSENALEILSRIISTDDVLILLSNGNIGGLRQALCPQEAA